MTYTAITAILFALSATAASAQAPGRSLQPAINGFAQFQLVHHEETGEPGAVKMLLTMPADLWTVTDWYKQNVYDLSNSKIGEMKDVLVDHEGKNTVVIVGVGGFLGLNEKDVAVPFDAIHFRKKDNDWVRVINTTKDDLKNAPGYKYDRNARTWIPEIVP